GRRAAPGGAPPLRLRRGGDGADAGVHLAALLRQHGPGHAAGRRGRGLALRAARAGPGLMVGTPPWPPRTETAPAPSPPTSGTGSSGRTRRWPPRSGTTASTAG